MTVTNVIYRDPKTGKIWQRTGGQDPIEIDADFARILNLDIDSIPFLQPAAEEKVICPNCGSVVKKDPFCSECGNKLDSPE